MRRLILGGAAALSMLIVLVPSSPAASGGGCQLQGTASFAPGLNSSSKSFSYSFGGNLTGCQSNTAAAPATGTVSAGQVVTINGEQFQEPVPTGTGSCSTSTTGGTAITTWADGTQTVIQYATTGVAAAVHLSGTVQPSVTLPAVNPAAGQPTSITITTTRYAGNSALGLLAFQPPDPTACNGTVGVTSAGISGFVGLGTSS